MNAKPTTKNYFEFKDDKSSKFWEISIIDTTVTTRYGKIGTSGQVSEKLFDDIATAEKEYNKLIAEKTIKGYKEIVLSSEKSNSNAIVFEDFNFKLQVIDRFIGKNIFDVALDALKEKFCNMDTDFSYEPIPQIQTFFEELEISQQMCDTITSFCPDGSDEIYGILVANWDGEDTDFDIKSLADIKYLSNLEQFEPSAMIVANIDLSPLLQCEKLSSITVDRYDLSQAAPFLKKGLTVNLWGSSIVPMRLEKFKNIKHLFPNDCWTGQTDNNGNQEFDDETILHIKGDWEVNNLDLDNIFSQEDEPEHIFSILIEGDLSATNVFNENTDGGTGFTVLGNATCKNMIVGGQEIYIAQNLHVLECFWGEYNHGDLVVKGQTEAKVFVATNEYHYEYDRTRISSTRFLLDEDGSDEEIDFDETIVNSIFVSEVTIAEEDFDEEVYTWQNFLDRDEIIEHLKASKSILHQEIDLNTAQNALTETLKKVLTVFNIKTFRNDTEFENQWQNFDKIIDFSVKQTETDSFEFDIYEGFITQKSARNKMTFITVDFPDNSSFFIQKRETEPSSFLEKLQLKSSTFYLDAMYRTHPDASYEPAFDVIATNPEVLEKLQTFWFLFLERIERAMYFYDLLYQTIKIKDLENYLNFPVIQNKYNDYNDSDKHGFWSGNYFYRFNRLGNPKEAGVVVLSKEIKPSSEFDIRSYYIKMNASQNPTYFGLHYCSSQSGQATDRYSEYSKIVPFIEWEKYLEVLQWYPKFEKALQNENENFVKYELADYIDKEDIKNQIYPKPIENVTFCGIDFKVISRLEADDLIGDLKYFEGGKVYDVHEMNYIDVGIESRKTGFFLLCETACETEFFKMASEINHIKNLTILGFIFKENITINVSLLSENEDLSTPFIALKNVNVKNAYFCGTQHYIGGDLNCNMVFGSYNHGQLIVKGDTKAFIIFASDMQMYFGNLSKVGILLDDCQKDIFTQVEVTNADGSTYSVKAYHPPTHNIEDIFLSEFLLIEEDEYVTNFSIFLDALTNGKPIIDDDKFAAVYADFSETYVDRIQKLFKIETLQNLDEGELFFEYTIDELRYNFFVKDNGCLQVGFWNKSSHYVMYLFYDTKTSESFFITIHYESDNETIKFSFQTQINDNSLNTFAVRKMFCDAETMILNKYNQ